MVCMGGGSGSLTLSLAKTKIFLKDLKIPNSAGLKSSQTLPHLQGFLLFPIYHGLSQKVRQLSLIETSTPGNLYLCHK